jgi:hypothetical protein
MKGLQVTCFILAMLALTAQSFRDLFVKFFEPHTSVLDKYEKKPVDKEIQTAGSLQELLDKYEPAQKGEQDVNAHMEAEIKAHPNEDSKIRQQYQVTYQDGYALTKKLHDAITDWEAKANEIRQIRIYWFFGFGLLLVGCVAYLKFPWLAMALIIAGISEMMWWTAPSFFEGADHEFAALLNNKLFFTNFSIVVILIAWGLRSRLKQPPSTSAPTTP